MQALSTINLSQRFASRQKRAYTGLNATIIQLENAGTTATEMTAQRDKNLLGAMRRLPQGVNRYLNHYVKRPVLIMAETVERLNSLANNCPGQSLEITRDTFPTQLIVPYSLEGKRQSSKDLALLARLRFLGALTFSIPRHFRFPDEPQSKTSEKVLRQLHMRPGASKQSADAPFFLDIPKHLPRQDIVVTDRTKPLFIQMALPLFKSPCFPELNNVATLLHMLFLLPALGIRKFNAQEQRKLAEKYNAFPDKQSALNAMARDSLKNQLRALVTIHPATMKLLQRYKRDMARTFK